jgi:hypothetical protein
MKLRIAIIMGWAGATFILIHNLLMLAHGYATGLAADGWMIRRHDWMIECLYANDFVWLIPKICFSAFILLFLIHIYKKEEVGEIRFSPALQRATALAAIVSLIAWIRVIAAPAMGYPDWYFNPLSSLPFAIGMMFFFTACLSANMQPCATGTGFRITPSLRHLTLALCIVTLSDTALSSIALLPASWPISTVLSDFIRLLKYLVFAFFFFTFFRALR